MSQNASPTPAARADRHWAEQLAAWAISPGILAKAEEPPFGLSPDMLPVPDDPDRTPAWRMAFDALGHEGGSVLDVGAGAGAASLVLVPRLSSLIAVDESSPMLQALAVTAAERRVPCETILGTWPAISPAVQPVDVVVCHHVLYNVADLGGFASELTRKANRRVVVEMTSRHPLARLNPLWLRVHGVARPQGPTAEDAVAVLRSLGIEPEVETYLRPPRLGPEGHAKIVGLARRQLCLPASATGEVEAMLADLGELAQPLREMVAISWPGAASLPGEAGPGAEGQAAAEPEMGAR
ncbi:MAG: class I SAM-dependent methyltransferase [Acidimicrobiales bacterium]